MLNAERRNDHIYGATDRNAFRSERPVVVGALYGHLPDQACQTRSETASAPWPPCVDLVSEALKHFSQNQISDGHGLGAQQRIQLSGRLRIDAVEVVDPDARIDNSSPLKAPRFAQVALPSQLAAQLLDVGLPTQAHQRLQAQFHGLLLGLQARYL